MKEITQFTNILDAEVRIEKWGMISNFPHSQASYPLPMAEEDESLEYARIFAKGFDEEVYLVELRNDDSSEEQVIEINELVIKKVDVVLLPGCERTMQLFKRRYNDGELKHTFTLKEYLVNEIIQELLVKLELNAEKFWYLLLLVYDNSYDLCKEGITIKNDKVRDLHTFLQEHDNEPMKILIGNSCRITGTLEQFNSYIQWDKLLGLIEYTASKAPSNPDLIVNDTNWASDFVRKVFYVLSVINPQRVSDKPTYQERKLMAKLLSITNISDEYNIDSIKLLFNRKSSIKNGYRCY